NGWLGRVRLNFDTKVRRTSFEPEDLFKAHIVGMDSYAIGLRVAHKLIEDNVFENIISDRYDSYTKGIGKDIVENKTDFKKLTDYALELPEIKNKSGQLEVIRAKVNQYLMRTITD